MRKYYATLTLFILNILLVLSQNPNTDFIEVLSKKKKEDLQNTFWVLQYKDSLSLAKKYAQALLLKGKNTNSKEDIGDAYFMMAYATKSKEESLIYTDSVIAATENNVNTNQPASAHLLRANFFAVHGRYKEAFKELDKANFYANSTKNIHQIYHVKYLIARFKMDVGDFDSSLKMLEEIIPYYENTNNISGEIISLWLCGRNLNFLKKPDSALAISNKAITLSLKTPDSILYRRLLLSTAISNYQKNNYESSLDSILKVEVLNTKNQLRNNDSDIVMYLYLGKVFLEQQQEKLAINNFKKVDSIASAQNYPHPMVRENYELLIDYYKKQNDKDHQLYYINKLLAFDSIYDNNSTYIIRNVNDKYVTPNLLLEKQQIIDSLEHDNSKIIMVLVILFCGLVLLSIVLFRNTKKRRVYEKRIASLGSVKKTQPHDIKDEITERVLEDLYKIEETQKFLDEDFNLGTLAKQLNTNTSYLSKIINDHKQKTFKQYLIELRINALLKNLDENVIMRRYSIEALAASIGYKNASSFTRIFKKYLGESPSSFLNKKYPERIR